jgi:hypothetical protein
MANDKDLARTETLVNADFIDVLNGSVDRCCNRLSKSSADLRNAISFVYRAVLAGAKYVISGSGVHHVSGSPSLFDVDLATGLMQMPAVRLLMLFGAVVLGIPRRLSVCS